MQLPASRLLRSVLVAAAFTAAAVLFRTMLSPVLGTSYPYQPFFLAVIISAWLGGVPAGMLSTVAGGFIVAYAWTPPLYSLSIHSAADLLALVLFLMIGTIMSWITANLRDAASRAEASAEAATRRENEYRSFFELSAVGAAEMTPPDGRLSRVNDKLCELTGYEQSELLRMTASAITHPEDRAADTAGYRKLLSGEVADQQIEKRLVRKDGSIVWVIVNMAAIRAGSGKLIRTVAVVQDVTSRRRTAEAQDFLLAASTILGSSLDPDETLAAVGDLAVSRICEWCTISLVQPDGSVRRAAIAHRDAAKRPLARQLVEKFPPTREQSSDVFEVLDSGQSILRPTLPPEIERRLHEESELGRILQELGAGPYIEVPLISRGRIMGVLSLMGVPNASFDEADLRVAQELASRAALAIDNALLFRASEAANRSKDEFFAAVSHELKTPMTTILGWSQMLQRHRLDEPTTNTAIDAIYRSSVAQAKIIDDILDVARISTGKLTLDERPVDLSYLIGSVSEAMRPAAVAKQVELRDAGHAESPLVVVGDPTRLQQIFMNLLTNAVKFTDAGGRVEVEIERIASQARVIVRDTGIGIPPDLLPHVFEAFRQGGTRNQGGLGLGLAIARRLVESHGGTIEARSDGPGTGAQFTVTLPLVTEPASAVN